MPSGTNAALPGREERGAAGAGRTRRGRGGNNKAGPTVDPGVKLSVLDLIPVRTDQTSSQALAGSRRLARAADAAGYTRYWVAEHHNMPAVASTVPGVLIPYLAEGTHHIRFGSGGVMLPNHTALAVAEQFALLAAMYPGRIDLGLGRAPGSDPVTAYLLRGGQQGDEASFEQDVTLLRELLGVGATPVGGALRLAVGGRPFDVRATPRAEGEVPVWLLGSSGFSAGLAARLGVPYVFAHHFGMPGLETALAGYRRGYVPSEHHPSPETFLPVNIVVAPSAEEAQERALPQLVQMVRLRTGAPLTPQLTVEEALAYSWSERELELREAVAAQWLIGTAEDVADRLTALAGQLGVDEVMVVPAAGAYQAESLAEAPGREATVRLLGEQLLG